MEELDIPVAQHPRRGGSVQPDDSQSLSRPPPSRACLRTRSLSKSYPNYCYRVMGATGSGKSSVSRVCPVIMTKNSTSCFQFINLASGSSLRIGMSLESSTAEVQLSDEFTVDGRRTILIDTPGFDDTSKSDADILKLIAAFLAAS